MIQKVDGACQESSRPGVGSTCESETPLKASDSSEFGGAPMDTGDDKGSSQSKEDNTTCKQSEDDILHNKDDSDESDGNESDEEVILTV